MNGLTPSDPHRNGPRPPGAASTSSGEANINEIHRNAATKLRAFSQRYTANRRTIVATLQTAPGPATIGEILDHAEGLAQSSTYRNLVVLEDAGVVHRIVTADDHARFELNEDITGHHHHHLVCERCGLIVDVTLPSTLEEAIDAALESAATSQQFHGSYHRLDLVGRCRHCTAE